MFKVGDKVICIDDDFTDIVDIMIKNFDQLPRKGQEYTIRNIERWDGRLRVLLVEITNPPFQDGVLKGVEPGFCASRFRKPETMEAIAEAVASIGETVEEEI